MVHKRKLASAFLDSSIFLLAGGNCSTGASCCGVGLRGEMSSHMSSEGAPKKPNGSRLKGLSVQRHGHDGGAASAPPELYGRRAAQSGRGRRVGAPGVARGSGFLPEDFISSTVHDQVQKKLNKPLRIMKFGGTSVGDASCIRKVTDIIRAASCESDIVVVVSAMSGVTNKLIEAATQSEAGNHEAVETIFAELRKRHDTAVNALIHSDTERNRIGETIRKFFQEGERLCKGTMLLRELTPRARDCISSLGERLSAPLVAAVLAESGVVSECIEATELVVTDSYYGGAEPWMDLTRESCEATSASSFAARHRPRSDWLYWCHGGGCTYDSRPWRLGLFGDHPGRGT